MAFGQVGEKNYGKDWALLTDDGKDWALLTDDGKDWALLTADDVFCFSYSRHF